MFPSLSHTATQAGYAGSSPGELLVRILQGDSRAEEELVQRFSRGVAFIIKQSVNDRALAEDVYQETFRLVIEKTRAGQVREPERLAGFICGIARNVAIDHLRKAQNKQQRENYQLDALMASSHPSQLQQLLEHENGEVAKRVLAAMPSERDRTVLYRFYINEETKETLCASLKVSNLHFNQILCRARERYRKLYEESLRRRPQGSLQMAYQTQVSSNRVAKK